MIVTFEDAQKQRAWEVFQVYLPLLFNGLTGICGWVPCGYGEGQNEIPVVVLSVPFMRWVVEEYHDEPVGDFDLTELLQAQLVEEVPVDFKSEAGFKLIRKTPFKPSTDVHAFFVANMWPFRKFLDEVMALELGGTFQLNEDQREEVVLRFGNVLV